MYGQETTNIAWAREMGVAYGRRQAWFYPGAVNPVKKKSEGEIALCAGLLPRDSPLCKRVREPNASQTLDFLGSVDTDGPNLL